MELLDSAPDPAQIQQARLDQLRKLWRLKAFTPVHKKDKPATAQTFHYKWVDKVKEGVAKSRFTCADVKRAYTAEQEQDLRVFVPSRRRRRKPTRCSRSQPCRKAARCAPST